MNSDKTRGHSGPDTRPGRRHFIGTALAAAASSLLPAGSLWADAANTGAIPTQLAAVDLSG